jgi:NADPH:quinone reductase-like Zn-dependent oxidoreductase
VLVSVGEDYLSHEKLELLAKKVEDGVLTLRVARVFPAAEAQAAHRQLEAGGTRGKLVLRF